MHSLWFPFSPKTGSFQAPGLSVIPNHRTDHRRQALVKKRSGGSTSLRLSLWCNLPWDVRTFTFCQLMFRIKPQKVKLLPSCPVAPLFQVFPFKLNQPKRMPFLPMATGHLSLAGEQKATDSQVAWPVASKEEPPESLVERIKKTMAALECLARSKWPLVGPWPFFFWHPCLPCFFLASVFWASVACL